MQLHLFALAAILIIRYQIKLLSYMEWGDESETIVAAKMMAAGGILYSEIFNHHGPLTFLPGFLLEKVGDFGIQAHRTLIAVLQWIAFICLYLSPVLKKEGVRSLYTIIAASTVIMFLPEIFGHMYKYQVIAGIFIVIVLSQYTLPAIINPASINTTRLAIGNILVASLPFLAITFLPAAGLLLIAAIRRCYFIKSLFWLSIGLTLNLLFLIFAGSLPGYLAYHIYLNSKILPIYIGVQSYWQLIYTAFTFVTNNISSFIILIGIVSTTATLVIRSTEQTYWRAILVALAIGSFLIRGDGFQALPFYYACIALPLVYFSKKTEASRQEIVFWVGLAALCLVKLSLLLPIDKDRINSQKIPKSTEFAELAKSLTNKEDKIIAYSFQNFQYIAANRLPASGHFFYLPWQEKYNENPKFNIKIDACQEIKANKPKIMLIDKWKVWGIYPWESYANCVQKLIDENYLQVPDKPYYIRKDIATVDIGTGLPQESYPMRPSQPYK